MYLIEGVGDEVAYALLVLIVTVVMTIAWWSTAVRSSLSTSVWLIQLQNWPSRRLLHVYSVQTSPAATSETRTAAVSVENGPTIGSIASSETSPNPALPSPVDDSQERDSDTVTADALLLNESNANGSEGVPGLDGAERRTVPNDSPTVTQTNHSETVVKPANDSDATLTIQLRFLDESQRLVIATQSESVGDFRR
ncbi:unnamed protein product [Soboliphyme baturini]|uniref:Transmembrane protein n=1 Tax=Soboliphyme baturini TaxID=241478 RepID=A0A183J737_9BILA|nr:unnamed protein product [Soboliphyme baturini]